MFMNSSDLSQSEKKYLESYNSDRYLFRLFNEKKTRPSQPVLYTGDSKEKPKFCLANGILRGSDSIPYAIHCNCGGYHPVIENNGARKVEWSREFVIYTKNSQLVEKEIRKMWALQL